MSKALYRSYRSKSFDEVVGQDHIIDTLRAALKSGRINHAYLFTGPRGVGKTSVARILARAVNGLPYEGEDMHLDIIEIDAASNRRIDEIRDLRDKVHISPTSAKYKVYIIDEVHMLTREAFNALLKTLEEPPQHVIFILATTEAHKLPETIISRTQRFNFKPIDNRLAVAHLKQIAKNEKIKVDEAALELIAAHAEGSFRDSISMLDQLASSGQEVTVESVRQQLGMPKEQTVEKLLAAIHSGDTKATITLLGQVKEESADAATLAKSLARILRQSTAGSYTAEDLDILKKLLDVPTSAQADELLEIIVLEAALNSRSTAAAPEQTPPQQNDRQEVKSSAQPKSDPGQSFDLAMWEEVLERVKTEAASIYTALRLAVPRANDQTLTLFFEFPLHQKKLNQAKAKDIIASIIEDISSQKLNVTCLVDKELVRASTKTPDTDFYKAGHAGENLKAISNIFGSVEMLES